MEWKPVNLLLVSTPWASPMRPSIQLGTLKSFVETQFIDGTVQVRIIPAHLGILVRAAGGSFPKLYCAAEPLGEAFYQLLFFKAFGHPNIAYSESLYKEAIESLATATLTADMISDYLIALEAGTIEFLKKRIAPRLSRSKLNVLGFTLNFNQVYASLYVQKKLLEIAPQVRLEFIFGGHSVSIPRIRKEIRDLGIQAYYCLGEGELKLTQFVRALQSGIELGADSPIGNGSQMPGIIHSASNYQISNLAEKTSQISDLKELPLPCYEDYIRELRLSSESDETFAGLKKSLVLMLEGSRGCFAKCDFCGFNTNWNGFRKLEHSTIVEKAEALARRYGVRSIFYVDNVCDTWAESFATEMIARQNNLNGYMELRAHHREYFWTAMRLAGINTIQVGVEALARDLLKKMRKGTTVIQNLRAQKYISELNIRSGANLITFHPKSNVGDAIETRRILELIPHFQSFNLSRFAVSIGSPIYEELSDADKAITASSLRSPRFSNALTEHELDWRYRLPPALQLDDDVRRAWEGFEDWYRGFSRRALEIKSEMTCRKLGSIIHVLDYRSDEPCEHSLEGPDALVLDACHEGLNKKDIEKRTRLSAAIIERSLENLISKALAIESDGHFLSLPLRQEQTLISRYFNAEKLRQSVSQ